jgi:hypothetical protein
MRTQEEIKAYLNEINVVLKNKYRSDEDRKKLEAIKPVLIWILEI